MAITPETLVRHELIGLTVRVVTATNPDLVGHEGSVISETMQTLRIETTTGEKTIPKIGATFEFSLPDDGFVTVDGARLVARPARRTEKTGGSKWRSV